VICKTRVQNQQRFRSPPSSVVLSNYRHLNTLERHYDKGSRSRTHKRQRTRTDSDTRPCSLLHEPHLVTTNRGHCFPTLATVVMNHGHSRTNDIRSLLSSPPLSIPDCTSNDFGEPWPNQGPNRDHDREHSDDDERCWRLSLCSLLLLWRLRRRIRALFWIYANDISDEPNDHSPSTPIRMPNQDGEVASYTSNTSDKLQDGDSDRMTALPALTPAP
jgi:hypothetical protein